MDGKTDKGKQNKFRDNIPIFVILCVSAVLNIYNIWEAGLANKYYAAGVYSMGQNFRAFFFNSLDSVGFITIDKPPLGLWIQVIFTKLFGFSGTVMILPQAIASVISVYLIYKIINKRFSKNAGLIAAAVLALSPIYVAVSRNNTIDGTLILMMVLAANQTLLATEKASIKHLVLAGLFIGLGFNIKMLQAYMIVPAIYLTYLIFAKQKLIKKILVCAVSVAVMAAVSLSWVIAVDFIPEENRPYVGSSTQNSALELAIGYNGINRVFRNADIIGGKNNNRNQPPNNNNQRINIQQLNADRPDSESGKTGFFRLYHEENAGQIAWFILPAGLVCLFMLFKMFKGKFKSNQKNIALLFFALCCIPMFIYFSFASGLSHRYYFATFAPFIAGLIGIGFHYVYEGKKYWFSIIFVLSALSQIYIQYLYKDWIKPLPMIMACIFAAAAITMLIAIIRKIKKEVLAVLMCTLLILPAIWSVTPIIYGDNSQLPVAGPEIKMGGDYFDIKSNYSKLIDYLEENREGAKFLAVTPSSMSYGADLILQSGEPVMVLGGFIGSDKPLTLDEFIRMIENNEVRYAIVHNDKANVEIYRWIRHNCTIIDQREYSNGGRSIMILYRLD